MEFVWSEPTDSSGHNKGTSPRIPNLNFYMTEFSLASACDVVFVVVFFFVYLPVTCVKDVEDFSCVPSFTK